MAFQQQMAAVLLSFALAGSVACSSKATDEVGTEGSGSGTVVDEPTESAGAGLARPRC
jgi:hypothetical protein